MFHAPPIESKKPGRPQRGYFVQRLSTLFRAKTPRFSPAWPLLPLDAMFSRPKVLDQLQSPLFGKLSAELRVQIYRYVIEAEDQGQFMHVFRDTGGRQRLAHRCCRDMDSLFPTWQHSCFGEWDDEDGEAYRVTETTTKDSMLYILLSCRRIYSETLDILYARNIFHFKRAADMLAVHAIVPSVQWHAIRSIHFSTVFQADKLRLRKQKNRPRTEPPEILDNWRRCCQLLRDSDSLRSIHLDIIIRASSRSLLWMPVEENTILEVLLPLEDVKAQIFEIELNVPIPQLVMEVLGSVNFETTIRQRPHNHAVFSV